jgi:hypothetical protein
LTGLTANVSVDVHLNNVLLGSDCVIGPLDETLTPAITSGGSADDPQLGWTADPISMKSTVDVPGATGCGIAGILDGIINATMGLPSSSSSNALALNGILNLGIGINPSNTPASNGTAILQKLNQDLKAK